MGLPIHSTILDEIEIDTIYGTKEQAKNDGFDFSGLDDIYGTIYEKKAENGDRIFALTREGMKHANGVTCKLEKYFLAVYALMKQMQAPLGTSLGKTKEEIRENTKKAMAEMMLELDFDALSRDYYGLEEIPENYFDEPEFPTEE